MTPNDPKQRDRSDNEPERAPEQDPTKEGEGDNVYPDGGEPADQGSV